MLPSASGIAHAEACPLSPALGGVRETTPAMRAGTEAHRAIELAARLGQVTDDYVPEGASDDLRAQLDHWWSWRWSDETLAWWPAGAAGIETETGVALDVATLEARRIPPRDPETGYVDSGLLETEIACTLDLAIPPGEDGVAEIVDWKSTMELALVPAAREAWLRQTTVYAVAWSLLHGGCDVRARLVQVGPDGCQDLGATLLSSFDLLGVAGELEELRQRIRPDATPRPGVHCGQCPGAARCPAALEAARDVVSVDGEPAHALALVPRDARHAAWLLDRAALARAYLDGLEAGVRRWVGEQPGGVVELGDGRVAGYESVREPRRVDLSAPGAYAELAKVVGLERVDQVAPREASLASIERAVRARVSHAGGKAPRGAIGKALEEAIHALTVAGIIRSGGSSVRWFVRRARGTPAALLEERLRASVGGEP